MFSDVEASTRLARDLGDEQFASVLEEHGRRLRACFARHAGVVVSTQGDGFFVVFAHADAAVAAAGEVAAALVGLPLSVRLGVHTGVALLRGDDYIGIDVHRAARIAAAGHGGQVVASATTRVLVAGAWVDLGEHRLSDLAAPERLYQLGPGVFPPLRSLHASRLPEASTPLVGRDRELVDVGALIGESGARVVTLVGPGGVGKTRLALEVGSAAVERYRGGVWWVSLAALSDPAAVVDAIAETVGARGDLAARLAGEPVLLVLDNFEQLIGAADDIARLVAACPLLDLLVTSREALQVAGERVYAVDPMSLVDAVDLFEQRARATGGDDAALEDSEAVVEAICDRLDRLPLAIELAARRMRMLSPEAILERLEQRLSLLTAGPRDAPSRQQTLRETIAWSYELLSPGERQLFARLSVFAGGCALEAAEAVCDADLDEFASLVDKSLLRYRSGRYWLLETVREYAAEQLAASAEGERMAERHVAYFLDLARRAAPYVEPMLDASWLDRLRPDRPNLRVAIEHAIATRSANAALELVGSVGNLWTLYGAVTEGRQLVDRALALGERAPPELLVEPLRLAGTIAYAVGDVNRLEDLSARLLELGRVHGLALADFQGHLMSYLAAVRTGDLDTAGVWLDRAQATTDHHGLRHYHWIVVANRTDLLLQRGLPLEAIALCDSWLASDEATRNFWLAMLVRVNAAWAALEVDERAGATRHIWEALDRVLELGIRDAHLIVLTLLLACVLAPLDPETAAMALGASDGLCAELGMVQEPFESARRAKLYDRLLASLGDAGLTRALAAGRGLAPETIVERASPLLGAELA
jgi:predicted ATPase